MISLIKLLGWNAFARPVYLGLLVLILGFIVLGLVISSPSREGTEMLLSGIVCVLIVGINSKGCGCISVSALAKGLLLLTGLVASSLVC